MDGAVSLRPWVTVLCVTQNRRATKGAAPVTDPTRFVGLDVHAASISIAVASERDPASYVGKVPNDFQRLLRALERFGPRESLDCVYEAGPTGYGLKRSLAEHGIRCEVIAPSKMPKAAGDRVKTDRIDAERLAHQHRCGNLVTVHVPAWSRQGSSHPSEASETPTTTHWPSRSTASTRPRSSGGAGRGRESKTSSSRL